MKPKINVIIILLFSLISCINVYAQTTCVTCSAVGFEENNYGSWEFFSGDDGIPGCRSGSPCRVPCNRTIPDFCVKNAGYNDPLHQMQTKGGFDPIAGEDIPLVAPFGGNNSLRLGDGIVAGSYASRATYTYMVEPATALFTYRYAVVIEEPATGFPLHLPDERPFFNVRVIDEGGNAISCGDLFIVAIPPITDFVKGVDPNYPNPNNPFARERNYWYRSWSTVVLPLSDYIGQCISIEFTTGDCGLGAHIGYAYIDASCTPANAVTSVENACGGYKLAAPTNASEYRWYNKADGTTLGIEASNINQTVDVNQAGTYVVEMSSLAGPMCYTTLEITVDDPGDSPTSFIPYTGCSGESTQFTDTSTPTNPITGWAWDFNDDGIDDAIIKNPTYTFPATGTYPVKLTTFIGDCSSSSTQDVAVITPVVPTIEPAGPFCISAPPITLITNIPGGTWGGPGITDPAAGTFDPSFANVGDGNLITYATAESCPGKDTVTIIVTSPRSYAGRDVTICTGGFENLGTPTEVDHSYSWSPTTGLNNATISNPTVTATNTTAASITTTYTLTTTFIPSNCSATDFVDVTVDPDPIVDAGVAQTICEGETVTLNGSSGGSTTSYTWTGSSGTYTPNERTLYPVYTPNSFEVATGSVELTLNSNDPPGPCVAAEDQVTIIINPVANVDAGPDQIICSGSAVGLSGSISGSATLGTWTGGGGIFNPDRNAPNALYTPNLTEDGGSITLAYITDDPIGTCPAAADELMLTIDPLPIIDVGPDQTICSGAAVLYATLSGGATTILWTGGFGGHTPDKTSTNNTYSPSMDEVTAGRIILTGTTNAVGVCPPSTDQLSIKINPLATVDAGIDQTICMNNTSADNTLILGASIGGSATGGSWSGGTGTYDPDNTDPNAVYTLSVAESSNPSISLLFTTNDPAGPCPATADQMMINLDQPSTVDIGPDLTICSGNDIFLQATFTGSASSVTWSGGNGTYSPNNTTINTRYKPTADEIAFGSVTIITTTDDPAGPCTPETDQATYIIDAPPLVNAGISQTICAGNMANLVGVYNGSASSGSWSGGRGGTFSPSNTIPNPVYTPSGADVEWGDVVLSYTTDDPAGPCPAVSDQTVVTINPLPTVIINSTPPLCTGLDVQLNGTIGGAASSATWSGGLGTFSPDSTTINAIYTPSDAEFASGSVILTLTTNNPLGECPATSTSTAINFFPKPTVNFIVDDPEGCPEHCVQFTDLSFISGDNIITTWNWTFGDGGTSAAQSPPYCYPFTGKYDVSLSVKDNNNCVASYTYDKMITVFADPKAEFYATPNPASIQDHKVTLVDQSSNDVDYWLWSFGDGDSLGTKTENPIHTYPAGTSGEYDATLIVRNTDFCYDSISHIIRVEPAFSFFIPNAFTPAVSKGVNDFFHGKGVGIIEYSFWVFDRWGNMVFYSDDLDEGWDGKANGGKRIAQQDVYVWKVHLIDVFNKPHEYIGTVTLVR